MSKQTKAHEPRPKKYVTIPEPIKAYNELYYLVQMIEYIADNEKRLAHRGAARQCSYVIDAIRDAAPGTTVAIDREDWALIEGVLENPECGYMFTVRLSEKGPTQFTLGARIFLPLIDAWHNASETAPVAEKEEEVTQ